jgi:phage shock protein A
MSESLSSRVSRIIAGSFHALIDAVEDAAPEAVMEQAMREIDAAIGDVRADLGTVEAQRHLTAKRLAESSTRHDELADRARMALAEGREDLAEAAVEKQIDIEAQIPVLEARLAELAEEKARLEGYVAALQAKKREMQDDLAGHRRAKAAQESPTGAPTGRKGMPVEQRAERATSAFDRVFERHTGLRSSASSSAQGAAKLAELEELARRNRVQERLAQIKSSVKP